MLSSWVMKPALVELARRVPEEEQRDREPERDADDVLLHAASVGRAGGLRPPAASGLEEELHLDAGELDQVVVLERVRRGADRLAVDGRGLAPSTWVMK